MRLSRGDLADDMTVSLRPTTAALERRQEALVHHDVALGEAKRLKLRSRSLVAHWVWFLHARRAPSRIDDRDR